MQDTEIKKIIEEKLPGSQVSIRDLTGTADHWEVWVVSTSFEGQSMLAQHRLVKGFFEKEIAAGTLHAFSLKTFTPAEWDKRGCQKRLDES